MGTIFLLIVELLVLDTSNIIDIHIYLMKKHDIKNVWNYEKNVY